MFTGLINYQSLKWVRSPRKCNRDFKGCSFMRLLFSSKNSKRPRRRDISSNSKPKRNVWVQPYHHHLVWNHSRYISFFQLMCQETFAELLCLLSSAVYSRTRTFCFDLSLFSIKKTELSNISAEVRVDWWVPNISRLSFFRNVSSQIPFVRQTLFWYKNWSCVFHSWRQNSYYLY